METSERLATIEALHAEAREQGLYFLNPDDESLNGRTLTLAGEPRVSFASCSYLGLEHHPAIIEGVINSVQRFGTQFSATRVFVSSPPYHELEELMSQVLGGYALVTSSTSLGHQSAFGVLATEKDAIVLDHQAHYSLQQAAQLSRTSGCQIEIVRHGELEKALEVIKKLSRVKRTVWFVVDGVYSMYGDLVPIGLLRQALEIAPNVRVYVDDAHGMSWAGKNGSGSFLSRMEMSDRIVFSTSLNKAFSAGGGCLMFTTIEERERVRQLGGPLFFSGPLQPPMVGAAIASARLHLSPDIYVYQKALRDRVELANRLIREAELPLLVENESPIFFLRLGLPRVAFEVARRMMQDGYYVTPSVYPTVPLKRGGIRLSITRNHTLEDVTNVIVKLAEHIPAVLEEEQLTIADLDEEFRAALPEETRRKALWIKSQSAAEILQSLSIEENQSQRVVSQAVARETACEINAGEASRLRLERYQSIREIEQELWDRLLGTVGFISWESLLMQEQVFQGNTLPEHNWDFLYTIVRDDAGKVIAATFWTVSLCKDDMLVRSEVSGLVEERRRDDPYFLTSKGFIMGSQLSEGNHLYLDREGPWREALSMILEVAYQEYERAQCAVLMLRDLPANDPELDAAMLFHGLVKIPMFDSHSVEVPHDFQAYMDGMTRRQRKHIRERIEQSVNYQTHLYGVGAGPDAGTLSSSELSHLYSLYLNVARKALRLNVFHLPQEVLKAMLDSPAWEIVTLTLDPQAGGPIDGKPVAFFAAHKCDGHYAGFFCGLDYDYVYSQGAYRQLIYQTMMRAIELKMETIHLGMTADLEKLRFGSTPHQNCVYAQARDHFNAAVLQEIAAEASVV